MTKAEVAKQTQLATPRSYFWTPEYSEWHKLVPGGGGLLVPFTREQKKELDEWFTKNRDSIRKKYGIKEDLRTGNPLVETAAKKAASEDLCTKLQAKIDGKQLSQGGWQRIYGGTQIIWKKQTGSGMWEIAITPTSIRDGGEGISEFSLWHHAINDVGESAKVINGLRLKPVHEPPPEYNVSYSKGADSYNNTDKASEKISDFISRL